jgi:type III restriction enzyme
MELNDYQNDVLNDLDTYLQVLIERKGHLGKAFTEFWQDKGVLNQSYKNNVKGVPHVCAKVPTAGGKTFIAVNGIDRIFEAFSHFNPTRPKFVTWLVPSLTILDQTYLALNDSAHPYRQRLNELFKGRVQIYQKKDVLLGAGFSADSVKGQLSIVIMSFDSLKSRNKEDRKAFHENGYLASFVQEDNDANTDLPEHDSSALINVIRRLKPVVIVDESHNAESPLSVEMLGNLNPSFILDITATPRDNSNIFSYVDAMRLKKMDMVKLPVIVANQTSQEDVVNAALKMRAQLEQFAKLQHIAGGVYIRPIVLFQAEPKTKDDTKTFDKIKVMLKSMGIPEAQIAIKTAAVNELKGVDLLSPTCEVRYIITVNALKEGWDCPFAYILATLANKSSVVDVTQIVGRILRMPNVRKQDYELLNYSYVFTASNQFIDTVNQVVNGLHNAGFTKRDCRQVDLSASPDPEDVKSGPTQMQLQAPTEPEQSAEPAQEDGYDMGKLDPEWQAKAVRDFANEMGSQGVNGTLESDASSEAMLSHTDTSLQRIKDLAKEQGHAYEQAAQASDQPSVPQELEKDMNSQKMKPNLVESAKAITLPQFHCKVDVAGGFFDAAGEWLLLDRANLLSDFTLANLDATVTFDDIDAQMFRVDLADIGDKESSVEFTSMKKKDKDKLNAVIRTFSENTQVKAIVDRLFDLIGKKRLFPIDDRDAKAYLTRIVVPMTAEQRQDCLEKDYAYVTKIYKKIKDLSNAHASDVFKRWLATEKIKLQPSFGFPLSISPSANSAPLGKSLYVREGKMGPELEMPVITALSGLENIVWWHRNLERGNGFVLNGFINHYPDFLLLTEKKNILLIETKGEQNNDADMQEKLELGTTWANQANILGGGSGYRFHYMMVFQYKPIKNALTVDEMMKRVRDL